jgi:hypothetical protein
MMNTAEDRVNIASYVKVLQTLGRFHLLPRLQYIYTERNEPQLLFLGSPHLRTFRTSRKLTGGVDADYVQSFLDLLPSTSPKTPVLCIDFPLPERCLHAIGRMPELKFLVTTVEDTQNRLSLGPDFWTNFASRQTLTWWLLQGNISAAPPPASGFSTLDFDSLAFFFLISTKETSIAEYTSLLRVGNFPSLKKIIIRFVVDHTPGQSPSPTKLWRDFFKHLRSATTNLLSLIEVKIAGPTASQVSFEDIPDLQTFTLDKFTTSLFHSLSAASLLTMFACWPDLTCLQISGVAQVTIGFSSLVEIARQLPLLEDLEIQINCTTFPTINDVPVLQHGLKDLKLSPLHLENHIALARFINRIFPDLVVLNISGSLPFLKPGVGKEIQEIYEGLQAAKKDHDQRKQDQVSVSSTFHRGRLVNCTHIYHVAD